MKLIPLFSFSLFLSLSSCSLFKGQELSKDSTLEAQKICLVGSGEGQILSASRKYPFNFETGVEEGLWISAIRFPFKDEVVMEVNLEDDKYVSAFENELLQNTKDIDPRALRVFLKLWSKNIRDIYFAQTQNKELKRYTVKDQKLSTVVKLKNGYSFKNSYFGVVDKRYFKYQTIEVENTRSKFTFIIKMHVRECLKKS